MKKIKGVENMDYVDRMKMELTELLNRYNKLEKFYDENFNDIEYVKRILIEKQKKVMKRYISILAIRLKLEGEEI